MAEPEYPIVARCNGVQGEVNVILQVGVDGRVSAVMEGATDPGTSRKLIDAAKENARQLAWTAFPREFEFPWFHPIKYRFELQGKPTRLPTLPLRVRTKLPDEIDVIAVPCLKSYLELEPATRPPEVPAGGPESNRNLGTNPSAKPK